MSTTRYIQAAVTVEDHDLFTRYAGQNRLTLSDLIEIAVKHYIECNRKEVTKSQADAVEANPN
jgi:hypothetical protein